ncbi:hypothetical protein H5410_029993 [Solanum commersonii]|uniref:Uncharacterized protein n=1 Tax=Solanum commersonii TaxID=4109 RepID=A0A9J5YFM6_SOLCO|nr:hypothetical protein H5410_029993 [Solanum commersonii]
MRMMIPCPCQLLGSFPAKISVRARMTLYSDFRNALVQEKIYNDFKDFFKSYPWGKECFDLSMKYLKKNNNLKKQSEVYKERGNASYALYGFPRAFLFGYMRLFLILVIMQRSLWILLCQFPVYLDGTWQRAITLSKVVHPYLVPTVRETKQNYMATLKSYTDEVKDTIIDALKANLKGVTVLTSAVENQEDEILATVDKHEDYTAPTVDEDGVEVDVDEILPLAIVDENLIAAVAEYFAEEIEEKKQEEKEEEQIKEKEEEKIEENKEQEKEEEQIKLQKEEKEHEKLEEKVDEGSDENSMDVMGIVMELNGELNGD